jgi:hypothetical protein
MPTVRKTPQNNRTTVRNVRSPRVNLVITDEIIEKSCQRDSSHCMIAEAVKLAVPGARHVSVDLQTIRFTDPSLPVRYTYLTPRPAQVALIEFDQGRVTQPFSVQLRGGAITATRAKAIDKPKTATKTATKTAKTAETPATAIKLRNGVTAGVPTRKAVLPIRSGSANSVPEISGGKTPPMGPLASRKIPPHYGKRRTFGLRSLEY